MYLQLIDGAPPEIATYRDGRKPHQLQRLGPLAKINAFIGANNSGKSRLLRAVLKQNRFALHRCGSALDDLAAAFHALKQMKVTDGVLGEFSFRREYMPEDADEVVLNTHWQQTRDFHIRLDTNFLGRAVSDISKVFTVPAGSTPDGLRRTAELSLVPLLLAALANENRSNHDLRQMLSFANVRVSAELAQFARSTWDQAISGLRRIEASAETPSQRIYIPSLRGAVPLTAIEDETRLPDFYESVTRANYGLDGDVRVFTGQGLYADVGRLNRSSLEGRGALRKFQTFLSENFFHGRAVEVVALDSTIPQQRALVLTVGESEFPLHDLGDGVNALILIAWVYYTCPQGAWVFIEEPEHHLHPGLQRILFETILNDEAIAAKQLRTFLTTHSNHFLDMALQFPDDVTVFSLSRSSEAFEVTTVHGPSTKLLDDLGVTNASVLLANCALWVEGPTDREYLRTYMRCYLAYRSRSSSGEKLREDFHFAFLEYAGSNLAHYLFGTEVEAEKLEIAIHAHSLTNRIILVADRDVGKEEKHARLAAWRSDAFSYYPLDVLEIENLIGPDLLRLVLPELAPRAEGTLPDTLSHSDYANERLGTFLAERVDGFPKTAIGDSGTLSATYKARLASLVARHCTWELMSAEARQLITGIVGDIGRHNAAGRGNLL